MGNVPTFDRLVGKLSTSERHELLERITQQAAVTDDPLVRERPEDIVLHDWVEEYAQLGVLAKLGISLRALFSGTDREHLVDELVGRRIGREIDRRYPGLIDSRRRLAQRPLWRELKALAEALQVFRAACQHALGSRRAEFVANLVALAHPQLHEQLRSATDPVAISERLASPHLSDVRREMEQRFNDVAATIGEEARREVYASVRALHHLAALAQYRFDDILARFTSDRACPLDGLRTHLVNVAELTFASRQPPAATALRALFLFHFGVRVEDDGFDLGGELADALSAAGTAYATVRRFSERVPLLGLVRFASGDNNWMPEETAGGEDWFALMRNYWKRRLDAEFEWFQRTRERQALLTEMLEFLGTRELPQLPHYRYVPPTDEDTDGTASDAAANGSGQPASDGGVPRPRYALGLMILHGFLDSDMYAAALRSLKILLVNGEFYRADNQDEFQRHLGEIELLPRDVARIDTELGLAIARRANATAEPAKPDGAAAARAGATADEDRPRNPTATAPAASATATAAAAAEQAAMPATGGTDAAAPLSAQPTADPQLAMEIADSASRAAVDRGLTSFGAQINILGGILHGQVGGRYDSIANRNKIGGRDNQQLQADWARARTTFSVVRDLLQRALELESLVTGDRR